MSATAVLEIRQKIAMLNEAERRQISSYVLKLGHESAAWRKRATRKLDDMVAGKQVSVESLRKQLGHA
jgi:hypothetical protein